MRIRIEDAGAGIGEFPVIARTPFRPPVPPELESVFRDIGIELLGVADLPPADRAQSEYDDWIRLGRHGRMSYLEDHAQLKFHPERLLPGCRSVIMVGINYYQEAAPARGEGEPAGRVARYAWGRDYHRLLGKRLKKAIQTLSARYAEDRFRGFTDATPLAERFYAERAGIGFTGRNTLTISSRFGSWFLIGEILTTRGFAATGPAAGKNGSCPSGCSRCIDVCPTGALESPFRINASKCISYLTIENKGSIPESLREKMGDWIFGCDLCQEVCPLNIRAGVTGEVDFTTHRAGPALSLRDVLTLESDEQFRFRFAGSPLARAGRRGLVRNACIAAANSDAVELLPILEELANGGDSLVAEHAAWAVSRLKLRAGRD